MQRVGLLRAVRPFLRSRTFFRRSYAVEPEAKAASQAAKVQRIESRLPRFLQRYIKPLRDAPASHITAFLLLHEVTAIVPLFGLAAFFHFTHWLPPYISEGYYIQAGTEKFGKWLRRRGWIDAAEDRKSKWFGRGEGSVRLVVEFATAYAITKLLLPLRIPFSIWLTPWFARWTVLPATAFMKRLFTRSKAAKIPPTPAITKSQGQTAVQSQVKSSGKP